MAPPKGHPRYGGRGPGTPNRDKTALLERGRALAESVLGEDAENLEPFDFLQLLYRDRRQPLLMRRDTAAILLPYTRPKLSAVVSVRKDVAEGTDAEVGRAVQEIVNWVQSTYPPDLQPQILNRVIEQHQRSGADVVDMLTEEAEESDTAVRPVPVK